ncbi:hypothetical protein B0H17DRAFT_1125050 [Mycena rosella]|uniref:Uncharacterized protein n=1 Tax=Mycena rosella TaxID=1033263 RepID=A0AAD7GYU9_MYCRO|nr:hypothetical protein B0H17DRAFT_1125050 [Mycena rosella]
MDANILKLRGVHAWLQDPEGRRLPLVGPAVIDGNQITAVVEIDIRESKKFHLYWGTGEGSPPINACCEIFRPHGQSRYRHGHWVHPEIVQVANDYMSVEDIQTQSCSTSGQLELPLRRDGWLGTPFRCNSKNQTTARKGFISLEIRRLRSPLTGTEYLDVDKPGSVVYEIDMEMTNDDDKGASKPPFIIFRFDFKPIRRGPRVASGKNLGQEKKADQMPLSPELSKLSDSEPEPENSLLGHPAADRQPRAPINTGAGSSNKRKRQSEVEVDSAADKNYDGILQKHKTILRKQQELRDEKEWMQAQREKLAKQLVEKTKVLAAQLEEEQNEAEQIEVFTRSEIFVYPNVKGTQRDIKRMEAALHAVR